MNAQWLLENSSQINTPKYDQENDEPDFNDYATIIRQKDEQISCLQLLLNDLRQTCASGRREPPPAELVRLTTEADLLRQTKQALKQQIVALQEEFANTCEEFDAQLAALNEEVIVRDEEIKRLNATLATLASKEEMGVQHVKSARKEVAETQSIHVKPFTANKRRQPSRVQSVTLPPRRKRIGWQWEVCRVQLRGRPDLGFSDAECGLDVSRMSLPAPQRQPSRLLQSLSRDTSRIRDYSRARREELSRDKSPWSDDRDELMRSGSLRPQRECEGRYREREAPRNMRLSQSTSLRTPSAHLVAPRTEGIRRNLYMLTANDIRRWLD